MPITPPISPNLLTAIRLPLAPIAAFALVQGSTTGVIIAALLALLIEFTDLADGWLARNYNAVSDFGKLFDPYADALSRFTLFLGLLAVGAAELWMIIIIFYRDSTISFLRSIAATQGQVLAARTSGKIKAVVQGVGTQLCFLALALGKAWPDMHAFTYSMTWWVMCVITLVTFISFVDYLASNTKVFKNAFTTPPVP